MEQKVTRLAVWVEITFRKGTCTFSPTSVYDDFLRSQQRLARVLLQGGDTKTLGPFNPHLAHGFDYP